MCLQGACLPNRVDPFGAIHANPARGMFMGNRGGKIHDPSTKTLLKRRFASRQWMVCITEFRGRSRQVMGNSYTELFFLDEVTAFAGHRSCAECRRADFNRYRAAIAPEFGGSLKADAIDRRLHGERMGAKAVLKPEICSLLPDGAMVAVGDQAFAKREQCALPWSFNGYDNALAWHDLVLKSPVLLTPFTTLTALQNGYMPEWHPSAGA